MKQVDDEVDEVEQHPPALFQSFDVMNRKAFLLQLGDDVLTERSDVRVRCTAGDEEEIRHVGNDKVLFVPVVSLYAIEEHDVLCFVVDGDLCGAVREREGVTGR